MVGLSRISLTLTVVLSVAILGGAVAAVAQDAAADGSWPAVKCALYKKAYADAIARFGKRGLGEAFLQNHDAFLASDCTMKVDVCPRSAEELNLANILVILSMNQGMASTFVPFNCRK